MQTDAHGCSVPPGHALILGLECQHWPGRCGRRDYCCRRCNCPSRSIMQPCGRSMEFRWPSAVPFWPPAAVSLMVMASILRMQWFCTATKMLRPGRSGCLSPAKVADWRRRCRPYSPGTGGGYGDDALHRPCERASRCRVRVALASPQTGARSDDGLVHRDRRRRPAIDFILARLGARAGKRTDHSRREIKSAMRQSPTSAINRPPLPSRMQSFGSRMLASVALPPSPV